MDAFCSVVRVFDLENVFILGGSREPRAAAVDTQKSTTFFNIKDKKFTTEFFYDLPSLDVYETISINIKVKIF